MQRSGSTAAVAARRRRQQQQHRQHSSTAARAAEQQQHCSSRTAAAHQQQHCIGTTSAVATAWLHFSFVARLKRLLGSRTSRILMGSVAACSVPSTERMYGCAATLGPCTCPHVACNQACALAVRPSGVLGRRPRRREASRIKKCNCEATTACNCDTQ